jgi:hypothetical protein
MDCNFTGDKNGFWYCPICDPKKKRIVSVPGKRTCGNKSVDITEPIKGPGDFLHDAILKQVGEGPTRECGCTDRIVKMNAWGPVGCREHLDEIVGWLVEQAKTHKWMDNPTPKLVRLNRWLMKLPGGTKPTEFICRQMVLSAIRKAERAEKATTDHP